MMIESSPPWQPIATDEEIAAFLAEVVDFHDACLREAHVEFPTWVSGNAVQVRRGGVTVRLLIHVPTFAPEGGLGVELLFEDVVACHVAALPPDCDPTILGAEIVRRDHALYWCQDESVIGGSGSTWVGGRRLAWRRRDDWTGDAPRYRPDDA